MGREKGQARKCLILGMGLNKDKIGVIIHKLNKKKKKRGGDKKNVAYKKTRSPRQRF